VTAVSNKLSDLPVVPSFPRTFKSPALQVMASRTGYQGTRCNLSLVVKCRWAGFSDTVTLGTSRSGLQGSTALDEN
jgi:hypothetical protein